MIVRFRRLASETEEIKGPWTIYPSEGPINSGGERERLNSLLIITTIGIKSLYTVSNGRSGAMILTLTQSSPIPPRDLSTPFSTTPSVPTFPFPNLPHVQRSHKIYSIRHDT